VILVAFGIAQPYFWVKTASERSALRRRAVEMGVDRVTVEIALGALYRGLFLTAISALLLLLVLHQML
jgi:hypothetical protein